MSLTILIVEKQGVLRQLAVKNYVPEDLFKKCGFKKGEGFEKHHEWCVKLNGQKYVIQLFGKTEGKANIENKYEFPPPVDKTLFFGACALVCHINKTPVNLTLSLWDQIYEKLMGGFDDCSNEPFSSVDVLDSIPEEFKTKQGGYLKDGFVVDDDEEIVEDEEEQEEDEWIDEDDSQYDSELSEESYV
jgi:hypothetical protein